MQGFPLHAGFFIDDSMLLVLKAQVISLHFPPCQDRYDTPMHERTESTESVDNYEYGPIPSKTTLGGQALARMVAKRRSRRYSVHL